MAFEPVSFTYDGDTVYKGGQGFRLFGIDADEMKEHGIVNQPNPSPQALKAKEYLDNVISNEQVTYEDMGSDKYGRRVVRIRGEDGRDINEELVRNVGVGTIDFDGVSPYHAAAVAFEDDVRAGRKILDRAVPFNSGDYIPERTIAQELGTGYARGKDQLGLMLGKSLETIGESLGVESLQQRGLDMSSKYLEELVKPDQAPQVGTYKDVDGVKSAALYAASLLGEQVPQLMADAAAFAGGAATGAGVGGIGAVAARRGVAAAAARIGMNIGGLAGAFSSMYAQNLGESVMEQEREGVDDNPLAYATAFAKAGADYIGAKAMLKTSKRMMLDGNEVSARVVAGEVMRSIGAEGLTESFQTMLDKAAIAYKKDGYDLLSDDNIDEVIDSFFAGAIVGGSVSGAGAGVRKTYDRFFGAKDEKTPDVVEQPEDVPPAEEKMSEAEPLVADAVPDTEAPAAD
ncbi:MAG: thermonuclease family protein, partial [Shewanella sp.]